MMQIEEERVEPEIGSATGSAATRAMLSCGIAYGALYILVNDVIAALLIPGYSRIDQAISELSAIGSPARGFLTATIVVFIPMLIAFGIGILRVGGGRAMRVLGTTILVYGVTSPVWLFFPMTAREDMIEGAMPANDLGHIGMTMVTVALIMTAFISGAIALRGWFRVYSVLTAIAAMVFGLLTSAASPKLAAGEPTPFMGLYERVNVFGWALWLIVLGSVLMSRVRHEVVVRASEAS